MAEYTQFPIPADPMSSLPVVTELDGSEYLVGVKNGVTSRFPVSLFVTPPPTFEMTGTDSSNAWNVLATLLGLTGGGNSGWGYCNNGSIYGSVSPDPIPLSTSTIEAYFAEYNPDTDTLRIAMFVAGNVPQSFFSSVVDPDAGPLSSALADYGYNDGSLISTLSGCTYWAWLLNGADFFETLPTWAANGPVEVRVT